jgi:hypothetical protein
MMIFEIEEVIALAKEYFPKTTYVEMQLLNKLLKKSNITKEAGVDILDNVKTITKYQTLPLPEIANRIKAVRNVIQGDSYTCYALSREGMKTYECALHAMSAEGAKMEFAKYLVSLGLQATDFQLYIGEESFRQFFNDRHERACAMNPKIRENVAYLERVLKGEGRDAFLSAVTGGPSKMRAAWAKSRNPDDDIPF